VPEPLACGVPAPGDDTSVLIGRGQAAYIFVEPGVDPLGYTLEATRL